MQTKYRLLTCALAIAIGAILPRVAHASASMCPKRNALTGRTILAPLAGERLAWFRRQHGFTKANRGDIVALNDANDAPVCRALNTLFAGASFDDPKMSRTYYKYNNRYFAAFAESGAPGAKRRNSRLFVIDGRFKVVGFIAPKV